MCNEVLEVTNFFGKEKLMIFIEIYLLRDPIEQHHIGREQNCALVLLPDETLRKFGEYIHENLK